MTRNRADALTHAEPVLIKDTFLERYEQDSAFRCDVTNIRGRWYTSPGYRNQWSFTECVRVGRDAIRVPMRELYKPKPAREILHAHAHVIGSTVASAIDTSEPHILIRVDRIVRALLRTRRRLGNLGGPPAG